MYVDEMRRETREIAYNNRVGAMVRSAAPTHGTQLNMLIT
jgi:hypothetical protein